MSSEKDLFENSKHITKEETHSEMITRKLARLEERRKRRKGLIPTSMYWNRKNEPHPNYKNKKYEENDIVMIFSCCDYPVIVGERSSFDLKKGFTYLAMVPTWCPCQCEPSEYAKKYKILDRKPFKIIHPEKNNEIHFTINLEKIMDIIIYWDHYFEKS